MKDNKEQKSYMDFDELLKAALETTVAEDAYDGVRDTEKMDIPPMPQSLTLKITQLIADNVAINAEGQSQGGETELKAENQNGKDEYVLKAGNHNKNDNIIRLDAIYDAASKLCTESAPQAKSSLTNSEKVRKIIGRRSGIKSIISAAAVVVVICGVILRARGIFDNINTARSDAAVTVAEVAMENETLGAAMEEFGMAEDAVEVAMEESVTLPEAEAAITGEVDTLPETVTAITGEAEALPEAETVTLEQVDSQEAFETEYGIRLRAPEDADIIEMNVISGSIAEIDYIDSSGSEIILRSAKTGIGGITRDISIDITKDISGGVSEDINRDIIRDTSGESRDFDEESEVLAEGENLKVSIKRTSGYNIKDIHEVTARGGSESSIILINWEMENQTYLLYSNNITREDAISETVKVIRMTRE